MQFGSRYLADHDEFGEIEAFQFKEVVAEVEDPVLEISLKEGRKLDPECEIGDSLGIKLDTDTFGRIAAQSAKQVIIQKMKDAEREMIYEDYKDRRGEIINGIVQRLDKGGITVKREYTPDYLESRLMELNLTRSGLTSLITPVMP